MIHPHTEVRYINPAKGYGLVATQFIPRGTITWVQDELDQIFERYEAAALNPIVKKYLEIYSFINKTGQFVLCWDNGKFVNHSFNPNCFSTPYDFEIAIRDIYPGEELTDDYGYLNVEQPFDVIDEGTPRKKVYPDDILHYYKEWDLLIAINAPKVLEADQLLRELIPCEIWNEFLDGIHNPEKMRSILECHYDRNIFSNTSA